MYDGSWDQDQSIGTYSTTEDTRSLSITLLPVADNSSSLDPSKSSTTNVALLYCEDPNGKISALLHRLIINLEDSNDGSLLQADWLNITSQGSKALPNEFRNPPDFNYSNTLPGDSGYNTTLSRTLYEADPLAVYNTPFFSFAASGGVLAVFYSPFNLQLNTTSPLAGDNFFTASFGIGQTGPGNFSLGMQHATIYTKFLS